MKTEVSHPIMFSALFQHVSQHAGQYFQYTISTLPFKNYGGFSLYILWFLLMLLVVCLIWI